MSTIIECEKNDLLQDKNGRIFKVTGFEIHIHEIKDGKMVTHESYGVTPEYLKYHMANPVAYHNGSYKVPPEWLQNKDDKRLKKITYNVLDNMYGIEI